MSSLEDLQKDADEIRKFVSTATRPRVKEVLQRELLSVEQEISLHQKTSHSEEKEEEAPKKVQAETKPNKAPLYTKAINSYGWDQSDKFVKIYITLPGVETLPKEKISSKFSKSSVDIVFHELDGKNHQLKIMKLCHDIVTDESFVKVKTGNAVVMMKKVKIKQTWEDVHASKTKESTATKPGLDDGDKDPQAAIMNLMKKMYDEGDDEMKKTINKAWSESMNKATTGEEINMSGL